MFFVAYQLFFYFLGSFHMILTEAIYVPCQLCIHFQICIGMHSSGGTWDSFCFCICILFLLMFSISRRSIVFYVGWRIKNKKNKQNASGIDSGVGEGNAEEANFIIEYIIFKKRAPGLLQGKKLQAHWFPHS